MTAQELEQLNTDAALWNKHKDLFPLALAILNAASPLLLNKLKLEDATNSAKRIEREAA